MFSLLIFPSVAHLARRRIRTWRKVEHLMAFSFVPFLLILRLVCVAVFVRSEAMQARAIVHQNVLQLRSSCILLR